MSQQFSKAVGKNIKVLDTASIVADKLKDYLLRHPEIEQKLIKDDQHRFLVTDVTETFQKNAEKLLDKKIELEKIEL